MHNLNINIINKSNVLLLILSKPWLITIKCVNEPAAREIKKFFINCFLCVTWAVHIDTNIIIKLSKIVFSVNLNGSK